VLGTIVGYLVAGLALWLIWRWQLRKREARARTGQPVDVPAKIRLLTKNGFAGRWREGILRKSDGRLSFRPWFAGRRVLRGDGPLGAFEIGTGTPAYAELVLALFADRPGDAPA